MQLHEQIADIIANPDKYTDIFPVPEPVDQPETQSMYVYPAEFFGLPQQGLLDRNSYNRPPRFTSVPFRFDRETGQAMIESFEVDLNGPVDEATDTMITREMFERARQRLDRSENLARQLLNEPPPQNYRWDAHPPSLPGTYRVDADGQFVPVGDGNDRGRQIAQRPDHYPVTASKCSCGFDTRFVADLEYHLAQTPVTCPDGQLKTWWVCDHCENSRLCRRTIVVRPGGHSMYAAREFDPTEPPRTVEQKWCDLCVQRCGAGPHRVED